MYFIQPSPPGTPSISSSPKPPPLLPVFSLSTPPVLSALCLLSIKTISDYSRSAGSATHFLSLTYWGSTIPSSPFLLTSLTSFSQPPSTIEETGRISSLVSYSSPA